MRSVRSLDQLRLVGRHRKRLHLLSHPQRELEKLKGPTRLGPVRPPRPFMDLGPEKVVELPPGGGGRRDLGFGVEGREPEDGPGGEGGLAQAVRSAHAHPPVLGEGPEDLGLIAYRLDAEHPADEFDRVGKGLNRAG
ncbi:MAG: hypothetical protein M1132_13540 [Chloroflexi bacterium]|nr:hypothetical protein [Chloroflexota bacterium]